MFSFRRHTDKRNGLNIDTREITLEPADNARLLSLCGPFDDNIKQLERRLGIEINRRDNHFKLTGRPICVTAAADILRSLYVDTAPMRGQIQDIEPEQIHLAIKEARVLEQSAESVPEYGKAVNIKTKRGVINRARQTRRSTLPIFSTMTSPSALARRVRVKPTWQWLRQLMPWSVRKFAVFC